MKILREAKIIAPAEYNHRPLCNALVDAFGGVTVTLGNGEWRDSDMKIERERVRIIYVAAEPTTYNNARIRDIALKFVGQGMQQQAVYIVGLSGKAVLYEVGADYKWE